MLVAARDHDHSGGGGRLSTTTQRQDPAAAQRMFFATSKMKRNKKGQEPVNWQGSEQEGTYYSTYFEDISGVLEQ